MNMILVAAALCGVFSAAFSQKIAYKDCGSQLAGITEVDAYPCTNFPCSFVKNTNISFNIHFTPNTAIADGSIQMFGEIAGVEVPFPLPNSNVCTSLSCPLAASAPQVYSHNVFIDPAYPTITLVVKVELRATAGNIICFTLPVSIS